MNDRISADDLNVNKAMNVPADADGIQLPVMRI